MEKTVVELFAGVGGFRLGLERSGFKTVWANQWEPSTKTQHAYEVYVANFGKENVSNEDINFVDKKQIPNHTLLVGGFPCQDYSVARTKATGIEGKKGVLWWSIYETLEIKKPKFILLENVDRLIKSPTNQRGRDFGVMLRSLANLGYSLEWRVINAAEYGFPQKRRRVFMFGAHKNTKYYKNIVVNEKVIMKNGFFSEEFPANTIIDKKNKVSEIDVSRSSFNDLVNVSEEFQFTFNKAGIMKDGKIITWNIIPKDFSYQPLKSVLNNNVSENYYIDKDERKITRYKKMKGSKKEPRVDKNGYEYMYSEGGMSFPDNINIPARTILTSETSVSRSTHVIEDPKTNRLRLLTPVECERLNGFPDNWTNPKDVSVSIPHKRRYFFMGNALIVGLIEKMGKTINKIINEEY